MTRTSIARIAGFTFLFYIAAGITSIVLFGQASLGHGLDERLASIARHVSEVRVIVLLEVLESFCAFVLGVTLYAITREQDPDLAMAGLVFRVGEGLIGIAVPTSLGLLWLATASGPSAPDAASSRAIGAFLLQAAGWGTLTSAIFFAVGSSLFSWLLLRGRMIPVPLAWLGVAASVLLVVLLPLQLAGFVRGPVTQYVWFPMLAFEVPLGVWLLTKGVESAVIARSTRSP